MLELEPKTFSTGASRRMPKAKELTDMLLLARKVNMLSNSQIYMVGNRITTFITDGPVETGSVATIKRFLFLALKTEHQPKLL